MPDDELMTYAHQVIRPALAKVNKALSTGPETRRILFSVDFLHIHEFLLNVLHHLITDLLLKGILVSIDRPYNYVTKLMTHRNIRVDRLKIVDIITSITTGSEHAPENVVILRSPFCDDIDTGLIDIFGGAMAKEHNIDIETTAFLLFDNIAVLDHYIELIYVKRLFVKLDEYLGKHPHLKTIIILDTKRQAKVYKAFDGWADLEIEL